MDNTTAHTCTKTSYYRVFGYFNILHSRTVRWWMWTTVPSKWHCIKLKTELHESESVFVCLCVRESKVSNLMHTLRTENKSVICFPCDGEYPNIRHKAAGAFSPLYPVFPNQCSGENGNFSILSLKFKK